MHIYYHTGPDTYHSRYLSNYCIRLCNFKRSFGYSGQGAGTVLHL